MVDGKYQTRTCNQIQGYTSTCINTILQRTTYMQCEHHCECLHRFKLCIDLHVITSLHSFSVGYNVYYKKEAEKKWRVKFADRTFLILRNLSFDTTYYVRVGVFYKDNTDARLSHTVEIKTFSLGLYKKH